MRIDFSFTGHLNLGPSITSDILVSHRITHLSNKLKKNTTLHVLPNLISTMKKCTVFNIITRIAFYLTICFIESGKISRKNVLHLGHFPYFISLTPEAIGAIQSGAFSYTRVVPVASITLVF